MQGCQRSARRSPAAWLLSLLQGRAADAAVTAADLQRSLQDLLASKATPEPDPAAAAAAGAAQRFGGGLAMATEQAHARAPAPPQVRLAEPVAAPAVVEAVVEAVEKEEEQPAAAAAAGPPGSFGGLGLPFLRAVQDELELLGYDLTSADAMQQLARASSLPEDLLPGLMGSAAATGVADPEALLDMARQWQRAIEQQLQKDLELRRKKQQPVWRCAVCGRYGCPVAPYIEGYQEVD